MEKSPLKTIAKIEFIINVKSDKIDEVANLLKDIYDKFGVSDGKLEIGGITVIYESLTKSPPAS